MREMPVGLQLDKILVSIAQEKVLRSGAIARREDIEEAWKRVSKKSNLAVHETRSLYKVLVRKYEQEKQKSDSTWKLFNMMRQIQEPEPERSNDNDSADEEQFEMYDIQDAEDDSSERDRSGSTQRTNMSTSDASTPPRSKAASPADVKDDKPLVRVSAMARRNQSSEKKKLLNPLVSSSSSSSSSSRNSTNSPQVVASALQKKGILVKRTQAREETASTSSTTTPTTTAAAVQLPTSNKRTPPTKTIQLSENMKRKLSEDMLGTSTAKRAAIGSSLLQKATTAPAVKPDLPATQSEAPVVAPATPTVTIPLPMPPVSSAPNMVNLFTIPAAPPAMTVGNYNSLYTTNTPSNTNGFPISFDTGPIKQELIFDNRESNNMVDFGNFENTLTPTFFKNLCNSSRHEAFGLYVANVLNRLPPRAASKLEANFLKSIADALSQSTE